MTQSIPTPADSAAPPAGGRKLRVSFVITDLDVGGAERALVELATRLDREAFDVRVWSLMPEAADEHRSLFPTLRAAGIRAVALNAIGVASAPRVVRRLTADWREWRPDVVQTFLFHANILGRLAARRTGLPHVVSGIRVAERRGRLRLRLDRWTDRWIEKHVCVSRSVAEYSHSVGGLPSDKLVVIPNGIDVARYLEVSPIAPGELSLPTGRRWITYVGRLDRQKGLDWLIEQTPDWLAAHPQHDLLLVGAGPERQALENLAARVAPAERVHFVGWQANVPGILAASDVLVLPSQWEGMPNVVLEAMASGRPVLAADVEGIRELLGDSSEQIAPPGDAAGWRAMLHRLLTDPTLAAELSATNRERAQRCFSLETMVQAYADLYRSLAPLPPM
ncbi:MAG TPA: glycosyltransferase [Pirellulales bacterium]|nr:glycosyltransferase [Pirellulales bacterium]